MRIPVLQIAGTTMLTFLAGCVVFPHGDLAAPPASGFVLDSRTLQPVAMATVTRRIGERRTVQVVHSDRHGRFALKKEKDLGWLLMVDYAANRIHYRIEAPGYDAYETNLFGGGSFARGAVPHDLGAVLLGKPQ